MSSYTKSFWVRSDPGASGDILQTPGGNLGYTASTSTLGISIVQDRVGGVTGNPHTRFVYYEPSAPEAGVWFHVALVVSLDNFATLYLDGEEINIGTRLTDGGVVGDTPGSVIGAAWVSNKSPSFRHFFAGSLDQVNLFNRELSSAEVQTLYAYVPEPSTALLMGLGLAGLARMNRGAMSA